VERTHAGEIVARFARDPDVPEFRVVHAEDGFATHDEPDADARTDGDVRKVIEALRRAPAALGQRRAVDVGVETERPAEFAAEPLRDVRVPPAGLRGGCDVAEGRRVDAQVDGTERGDAQRTRSAMLRAPAIQHGFDLAHGFFTLAGRQSLDRTHVVGTGAENAHALRAAQFDAGE
jgi:hypothetical protein